MRVVQPAEFKNAFLATMDPAKAALLKKWHGRLGEYTALMRKCLPMIAGQLHLEIYNGDYYTIDAILYETKDVEHFDPTTTYAHYIAVAIEHENNVEGAYAEMNKLQLVNSPLKVLITYAPEKWHQEYLNEYADIIRRADVFGDISTHRKQLVVFGHELEGEIRWYFYQYSEQKFVRV